MYKLVIRSVYFIILVRVLFIFLIVSTFCSVNMLWKIIIFYLHDAITIIIMFHFMFHFRDIYVKLLEVAIVL